MKTKVIVEAPALVAYYSDYNESSELAVSIADLQKAPVGRIFSAECGNCGRDVRNVYYEVVYKTQRGCALLERREGATDSPNPTDWCDDPTLVWVEYC